MQSQLGEPLNVSLALILASTFSPPAGKGKMTVIKTQKDVLWGPEEQVMALSHDRMVLVYDHVAFGDFLKPSWDEVARYQLRPSALMSHQSVKRIRRFFTSQVPLTQSDELE